MNNLTAQSLHDLFTQKKYQEIIKITTPLPQICQENIPVYYYHGLSLFYTDQPLTGAVTLCLIFTLLNQNLVFSNQSIQETIAKIAQNIISLCPLIPETYFDAGRSQICNIAVSILEKIGQRLPNHEYADFAQITKKNFVPTSYPKNPGFLYRCPYPAYLQIEPTNCCNLSCKMCPRANMSRKQGFLTLDTLEKTLSSWSVPTTVIKIENALIPKQSMLFPMTAVVKLFFMGEPLLHPQLNKLISLCNQHNCKVGIQTNGFLFQDQNLREKILNSMPASINFSIDGTDHKTYKNIRRGSDSKKLFNSIKLLDIKRKELNLEKKIHLTVSSIITNNSEIQKEKIKKFLKPIEPFVDLTRFIGLETKYPLEFIDDKDKIVKYSLNHPNSHISNSICREPLEKLTILWDGTIIPCCNDINGMMKLGDVQEGIDAVWQNESTRKLQNALLANQLSDYTFCTRCLDLTA